MDRFGFENFDADTQLFEDEEDFAGTFETATPIEIGGGLIIGTLDDDDDVDTFSVEVEAGQTLRFGLFNDGLDVQGSPDPADITILNADGDILGVGQLTRDGLFTLNSTFDNTETIFIEVASGGNAGGLGEYNLIVENFVDDFAGDNTSEGQVVLGGDSVTGNLQTLSDSDFFALNVIAGQEIEVTLTREGLTGLNSLQVLNSDGEVVARLRTDGQPSSVALGADVQVLTFTAETSDIFFIDVRSSLFRSTTTQGLGEFSLAAALVTTEEPEDSNVIEGTAGEDTLEGTIGDDEILGLDGDDNLIGLAGDDILRGGDGNDQLDGDGGNDQLFGGNGNDGLFGGAGNDLLDGGAGDDVLQGSDGQDTINGGAGDDLIRLGDGEHIVDGGDGIDRVDLATSFDNYTLVENEDGSVAATFDDGSTVATSTLSNIETLSFTVTNGALTATQTLSVEDFLSLEGGTTALVTSLDNFVVSTGGNDLVFGSEDADFIEIFGANDLVFAGGGDDTVNVGGGEHRIDGGDGVDTAFLIGNQDEFTFEFDVNGDLFATYNGEGGFTETTFLSNFEQVQFLDTGVLEITSLGDDDGGSFFNEITGTDAAEVLIGTSGNDEIIGQAGNDAIIAGGGDDLIDSGQGEDYLVGGDGFDTFAFSFGDGHDSIVDFEIGVDFIDLSAIGFESFDELLASSFQDGTDLVIGIDENQSIRLQDTNIEDLDPNDFSLEDFPGFEDDFVLA